MTDQDFEINFNDLEMGANMVATEFLMDASESLGVLLEYAPGNELEILKKYPVLVATHALIAFMDYELNVKREYEFYNQRKSK